MSTPSPQAVLAALSEQLLAALCDDLRSRVMALGHVVQWKKQQHLFLAGERAESLHFLLRGKLKDYYCDSSGGEFLRRVIHPNDMVAMSCLCHPPSHHNSSCRAMVASVTFSLPRKPFQALARAHGALAVNVSAVLSRQGERACRNGCLIRKRQAKARVAGYLLSRLQDRPVIDGEPLPRGPVTVDLSPLALSADEICLARETFSRALVEMERDGLLVNRRGMITIHDRHKLMDIAIRE
jgi:CRP-like cAMP-binding protein